MLSIVPEQPGRKTLVSHLVFSGVLLCLFISVAFAGTDATTVDGRAVLLHEDGTWEFKAEPAMTVGETPTCAEIITSTVDKMSGNTLTTMTDSLVVSDDGQTGLVLSLFRGQGNIVIWVTTAVGGGACVDDDDKMNILFRDGTRLELENDSRFNCDGSMTLYFGDAFGKSRQLKLLRSKDVESIRVWTRGEYVQRDLTPDQSFLFKTALACLSSTKPG